MAYQRQGTCNRCGQCCGAEGSPNQTNPWPRCWPGCVRTHLYPDFESVWPHAQLVGLQANAQDGTVEQVEDYGNFNLRGKKIYWRWVPGNALCKNLEPYDDPNTYSLECPLLLPDPGDGTRPCALVGTNYEWMFTTACDDNPDNNGIPPLTVEGQAEVDLWFQNHPLCSFEYVEQ